MKNGQDKYRERQRFEVGGIEFFLRKIPSGGGVSAFWIMETQVTQALWEAMTGINPSHYKDNPLYQESPQQPVEQVSWEDAVKFANALSEKLGLQPAYKGGDNDARLVEGADGFRLPFEAEWEWAAKGGEDHEYAGSNNLDEVGWYGGSLWGNPRPVAQLKANGYGCFDFSGNVWEWCADDYFKPGQHRPGAAERVIRGGSWINVAGDCRVSYRNRIPPGLRCCDIGFRLAAGFQRLCRPAPLRSLQRELRYLRTSRQRWPEGADAEFICLMILEGKSVKEREAILANFRRENAKREKFLKEAIKRLQ